MRLSCAALLFPVLVLAGALRAEDSFVVDGFKYVGRINGLRDGKLSVTLSGGERTYALRDVSGIALGESPEFTAAEAARAAGEMRMAAARYGAAVSGMRAGGVKQLAELRAMGAADAAGRWAEAAGYFVDVYAEVGGEAVWEARPRNRPPLESSGVAASFDAVTAAIRRAKGEEVRRNLEAFRREILKGPQGGAAVRQPIWDGGRAAGAEAPLAAEAEVRAFHREFDEVVGQAERGPAADRRAAGTRLEGDAEMAGRQPGVRRLLLCKALELALGGGASDGRVQAVAAKALGALRDDTEAVAAKRVEVLQALNRRFGEQVGAFRAAAVAEALFTLTDRRQNAGRVAAARESLTEAAAWAQRDAAYGKRMAGRVALLEAAIGAELEADRRLAAGPDDPRANTAKGLAVLCRSDDAGAAAAYLGKSDVPQYRRLGAALAQPEGVAARLEVASAAVSAAAVAEGDARLMLARLAAGQVFVVARDGRSTAGEKAEAKSLQARAEEAMAGPAGAAENGGASIGAEASSRRVVYIVDRSGSMLDNFDLVVRELSRSIQALGARQSVGVVFVSGQVRPMGMAPATPAVKEEMVRTAEGMEAEGQNDDLLGPFQQAFEAAFGMKPDTIYFLTDGRFGDGLPGVVAKLNAGRSVKVNTVAFVREEASYRDQLKELAAENGGTYRFVPEESAGEKSSP
jgi:hypothetical protein